MRKNNNANKNISAGKKDIIKARKKHLSRQILAKINTPKLTSYYPPPFSIQQ